MNRVRARVLPLAMTHGLVMATLYVLKPVRNALVLDRLGVAELPWVLLLVAILGGAAAALFARLSRGVRLARLVPRTFIALMACLGGFRLALSGGATWLVYAFYLWVTLYGLLVTSLLWLLANELFDAREARRQFGFIGSGGIVGAVLGGLFTGRATHALGTENLLLVCIGLLAVALGLLRLLPAPDAAPPPRRGPERGLLESVRQSELLRLLAVTAAIGSVVAVVADVQFNRVVSDTFASRDAKTAFFGEFFACLSALAFAFQMLLSPRILARWGVGVALLFLPAALGTASVALMAFPALWTAILVKGADGGLRHSIHKSATEIVMIPVPADVKQRTKLFLDATMDTVGQGVGALAVLVLLGPLGIDYSSLGVVSVVLVVVWLALAARTRRAYVGAFRDALARREIDLTELRTPVAEARALDGLRAALESPNERQVLYALDLLAGVRDELIVAPTRALLSHRSPDVRRRAVRVLSAQGDPKLAADVEALLADPDADVRLEAMSLLFRHQSPGDLAPLRVYLAHEDARTRCAAVAFVAEHGSIDEKALVSEPLIESFLGDAGDDAETRRVQIARALGPLGRVQLFSHLERLMSDASLAVAAAAMESAGRTGDARFVPALLDRLAEPRHRGAARAALVALGGPGLPGMGERLADASAPRAVRLHVLRVLAELPLQASIELLLSRSTQADAALRIGIARSLSKLRRRAPDLAFDAPRVRDVLRDALRTHCEMLHVAHAIGQLPTTPSLALLKRAVAERAAISLEQAFRLLGLLHAPKDMHAAHEGLSRGRRDLRASAIEFLDNVLSKGDKALLVPLLEPSGTGAPPRPAELGVGAFDGPEDALGWLARGGDAWLRACAVAHLAIWAPAAEASLLELACADPDPVVREIAEAAASRARASTS